MILYKFSPISSQLCRRLLNKVITIRSYCKPPDQSANENGESNQDIETVTLNFVKANGKRYQVRGIVGIDLRQAVMRAGMNMEFDDYGFCGGNRWCTSCHTLFQPEIYRTLPNMTSVERQYAEFLSNYQPGASRLGCQVNCTKEMEGAVLYLPKRFPDDED